MTTATKIIKRTLTITVLQEADAPRYKDLAVLAEAMADGDMLGMVTHEEEVEVDAEEVAALEVSLGGDGTFFSSVDD